jgi:multidrug efflux pump subunit AcrA (membrane-fusion protein)
VTAVYPVAREVGGVVLYDVRLSLDDVAGSAIKVGMSATTDIEIAAATNTLILPSRAITENEQGQPVVMVSDGGEGLLERVVTVGLDDGLRTEITGGLTEGETVVIELRR